jgi:hypothetical protein
MIMNLPQRDLRVLHYRFQCLKSIFCISCFLRPLKGCDFFFLNFIFFFHFDYTIFAIFVQNEFVIFCD